MTNVKESEAIYEYHASQYDPPSKLLDWWHLMGVVYPDAKNILEIHCICRTFFDLFDPDLVVYVVGSFARYLQIDDSDINLYIPSHTRKDFERAWARSHLRKPKANSPNKGVSVAELLGAELARDVTICFGDDGCSWMERDVKVQIHPPNLEQTRYPTRSAMSLEYRGPYLWTILRKCWYAVQRCGVGENGKYPRPEMFYDEGDMRMRSLCPSLSVQCVGVFSAIAKIRYLLVCSVDRDDWSEWLPEYSQTVLSWVDRFSNLPPQIIYPQAVDDDAFFASLVANLEEFAAELSAFEEDFVAR